jgi:MoxR-like ATPase
LFAGRDYIVPDDVIEMAPHVLGHRILMKQEANIKKVRVEDILKDALERAVADISPQ